jgi:formimidoylglutamate deiminase
VQWLCRHVPLDARWQLVHATHVTREEIAAVAATGAGIVLCPTTEANLGDGITDLPAWLEAGVPIAIGSDSNVCRDWPQELRWLEYGQRLALRRRNIAAAPQLGLPSTGERLFDACVRGGTAAAGLEATGLRVGAWSDACGVRVDTQAAAPCTQHAIDGLIFGGTHNIEVL